MSDDFVTGGIIPVDDDKSVDGDFDPDAVDSDDFLDDTEDDVLDGAVAPISDIDDALLLDEEI